MSDTFCHLHVHSDYSLLDGAQRVDSIVKKVVQLGMPAVALTDHGALYGAMEFYHAAIAANIKPIIGIETYVALQGRRDRTSRDHHHLTLLAANERGYKNLLRLSSLAFTEGFYYKPRIDLDLLAHYNEGIICLSGCLSGLIQEALVRGDERAARTRATRLRDIFGDRFYMELMRHTLRDQVRVEPATIALAREIGVPIVATNDAHYVDANDHATHDLMLCVQTGKTLDDPSRMRFDSHEFYLKSPAQMRALFGDLPEACDATLAIAERCELQLEKSTFHIPSFSVPPKNGVERTPQAYLRALCQNGLQKRYGERATTDAALCARLDEELAVIERMGFASYFLIVWDFIKYAREHDIAVGPGRGSVVGSVVSYCLRITDIDPLRFGLTFERFLNPHRVTMPDIDTDFCVERRNEVIAYVKERYGEDCVAQIITFGTLLEKQAIRDAGRALGVPIATVDAVAKAIEREETPQFANADEARLVQTMLHGAHRIKGLIRNSGTHAAGIVIGDKPLVEYIPLAKLDNTVNTQYEMGWIEQLGLVKMDLLGLRNLTIMQRASENIRLRDPGFEITTIPDDDNATFVTIARGDTTGIFQLESPGMRRMLRNMQPDRIEDLIAAVALYRPGPMEWIPAYIEGKRGEREPSYIHPKLEPILRETYGIACYQEQVMQIARDIAGFSLAEADDLRRIIGKKHPEEMPKARARFIASAETQGVVKETAEAIFTFIEPFAGYGFNKAHAVAYAMISYQTAYLKTHYPVEFFGALLDSVVDDPDKMAGYLSECRLKKITLLGPHVNRSNERFRIEPDGLRFSLRAIRGLGDSTVSAVLDARHRGGTFDSIDALAQRSTITKKALELLVRCGACDAFGEREYLLAELDGTIARGRILADEATTGQQSLFLVPKAPLERRLPINAAARLTDEHALLGIYLSGHPANAFLPALQIARATPIAEALAAAGRHRVGGILSSVRRFRAKRGTMLTATLDDPSGSVRVVLFPGRYDALQGLFRDDMPLIIEGRLRTPGRGSDDRGDLDLAVEHASSLNPAPASRTA